MSKVGIVIVNYNGEKYQNECIRSLQHMSFVDFEIIVVDSGSNDKSIELLKREFPQIHILEQHKNVGVAVGNNIGIDYSRKLGTQYTLLLNNDTEVDENLLDILIENSEGKYITVPKIYYYEPNNLIWFAGGDFDFKKGISFHKGEGEYDCGQFDNKEVINYAPTCCMLIPNYIFDIVGKIDEKTFMYFDDTDFCLRVYENNIPIFYVPRAFMWHKVGSSSGGEVSPLNVYYNTRNRFYFINKYPQYMSWKTKLYAFISNIIQYIISPIRCKNDKYIKDAMIDYYKNNMGKTELKLR